MGPSSAVRPPPPRAPGLFPARPHPCLAAVIRVARDRAFASALRRCSPVHRPPLFPSASSALRAKAPPFGYLAPLGSPLLANIYLHPLDEGVNECRQKPRMIRYADDLVILCRPGEGPGMKERLARWLQSRGLALNEAKTRVLQSRESGFKFLGFSFRWQQSKKGTPYVHTELEPRRRAGVAGPDARTERAPHHLERNRPSRARNEPSEPWLGPLLCPRQPPPLLWADERLHRPSAAAMALAQARPSTGKI